MSELKANPDTLEQDSVEQSQVYEKVCVDLDWVDALLLRPGAGFHRRSDICPTRCCGKGNLLTTEDWQENHLEAVKTVDSGNTCRSHTCRRHVPDNVQSRSGRSAAPLRSTVQSSGDRCKAFIPICPISLLQIQASRAVRGSIIFGRHVAQLCTLLG